MYLNVEKGAGPFYTANVIRAAQVIPSVLAEVIRKAPLSPEKVEFAWRHSVGPALHRVTTARLDDQRALHVTAADAHWAREVKRATPLILKRLETMLGAGTVTRIKV
jgi:hypothetical protein